MVKKRFFRKIPRAKIYLKLSDLLLVFLKILLKKLKLGEKTSQWEKTLSDHFGFKETIMFSRARLAFFYLLKNFALPKESEVILTPLTIADIVNAVRWAGLKPVFCDLGENTYNIDYQKLEQAIGPNTKAVLITHLTGLVTNMDEVQKIVEKHNLILIEDISQTFGATFKGKYLGTFGLASISSLSFLKTCCTLFGGMLGLNNPELAEKIRKDIKTLPRPSKKLLLKEATKNITLSLAANRIIFSLFTYYLIKFLNKLNSNALEKFIKSNPRPILSENPSGKLLFSYSDVQSEMGLKILKKLKLSDDKRIANAKYFIENLSLKAKTHLPVILENGRNVFWRLPLETENPEDFKKYLFKNYIDSTKTNLVLASEEPSFGQFKKDTPEARKSHQAVLIPVHSSFSKKDMIYMAKIVSDYFTL